jgi:hypothetical protein
VLLSGGGQLPATAAVELELELELEGDDAEVVDVVVKGTGLPDVQLRSAAISGDSAGTGVCLLFALATRIS